jgi:uncharacterized membrane protein
MNSIIALMNSEGVGEAGVTVDGSTVSTVHDTRIGIGAVCQMAGILPKSGGKSNMALICLWAVKGICYI